jgi:hypothetical protein
VRAVRDYGGVDWRFVSQPIYEATGKYGGQVLVKRVPTWRHGRYFIEVWSDDRYDLRYLGVGVLGTFRTAEAAKRVAEIDIITR